MNGLTVKFCPDCKVWWDHFRAGHTPRESPSREDTFVEVTNVAAGNTSDEVEEVKEDVNGDDASNGAFARLSQAGLI